MKLHPMKHTIGLLIALDTSVRLSILTQTIVLGRLVIITAAWSAACTARNTSGLSTLGTGLMRVDLAMGKFY